jgi:hypothetical protein
VRNVKSRVHSMLAWQVSGESRTGERTPDWKSGSVVVSGQCAHRRLVGVVVVPDRGGQREDPLEHANDHAARGSAAMPFEVELALAGLVDRLDDLPQRLEQL